MSVLAWPAFLQTGQTRDYFGADYCCPISLLKIEEIPEDKRLVTTCCRTPEGAVFYRLYSRKDLLRWLSIRSVCPLCQHTLDLSSVSLSFVERVRRIGEISSKNINSSTKALMLAGAIELAGIGIGSLIGGPIGGAIGGSVLQGAICVIAGIDDKCISEAFGLGFFGIATGGIGGGIIGKIVQSLGAGVATAGGVGAGIIGATATLFPMFLGISLAQIEEEPLPL